MGRGICTKTTASALDLSGVAPGRASPTEVTIFDSVGFALEDYSTLRYLYKLQRQQNQPRKIDLIPHLENPKNLFGLLGASTAHSPKLPPSGRPLKPVAAELTST